MKQVLLSLCLTAAVITAPTTLDRSRVINVEGDVAIGTLPSTLIVIPLPQHEVHAVVVDMPQHVSLEHASPESWGTLSTFDPPYEQSPATTVPHEQSPATTVFQVAMIISFGVCNQLHDSGRSDFSGLLLSA